MTFRVASVNKTCNACPAQFEIKLESGHMVYVRYRHGRLSVRISEYPTDDILDAVKAEPVVEGISFPKDTDPFDGVMEIEELIQRTSMVFDWSAVTNTEDERSTDILV